MSCGLPQVPSVSNLRAAKSVDASGTVTKAALAQFSGQLVKESEALMARFRAAPDDQKGDILKNSQVVGTIDEFVIAAHRGSLSLPLGTDPMAVVAPAVKPFLENGIGYFVRPFEGGDVSLGTAAKTVQFSLEQGQVRWSVTGNRWSAVRCLGPIGVD